MNTRLLCIIALLALLSSRLGGGQTDLKQNDTASHRDVPAHAAPATRARDINKTLKELCLSSRKAKNARPADVKTLLDQLGLLGKLNKDIQAMESALGVEGLDGLRARALHNRAVAWLNAWCAFSDLVKKASLEDSSLREQLIGGKSALDLLLEVYGHISQGEKDQLAKIRSLLDHQQYPTTKKELEAMKRWEKAANPAEPLRQRLAESMRLKEMLGCTDCLKIRNNANGARRFIIPSFANLVGSPNESKHPGFLSLWTLVNLQLDTWHGQPSAKRERLLLAPLAKWLKDLSGKIDLQAFSQTDKRVEALSEKFKRLHHFIAFRDMFAAPKQLAGLLKRMKEARSNKNSARAIPEIVNLAFAAQPLGNEGSLPQAAIYLRYVVLLSYQQEGAGVVARLGSEVKGKDWWLDSKLPGRFLAPLEPGSEVKQSGSAFVRWNRYPGEGHYARALASATAAAYRYARWEAGQGKMAQMRYRALENPAQRRGYLTALHDQTKELKQADARHVGPYFRTGGEGDVYQQWLFPRVAFGINVGCTKVEGARVEADLARLAASINGANRMQQAILEAHEAKDPAALSAWLQGPATTDGLARWNPTGLPERSFDEYYLQVIGAVKKLDKDLKDDQWRRDLRALYEHQVQQNDIVADEEIIRRFGLEIAQQGKQIADIFKQLAKLDKQIAELGVQVDKLEKDAATNKAKAMELRLGLAEKARAMAAAKLEALKEAITRADRLVSNAIEQLEAMQPRLLDAASKIRDQKRKSAFFSFLKTIVTVVGLVVAPFTGGESIAIANTVNQVIVIAEKLDGVDFRKPDEAFKKIAEVVGDSARVAEHAIDKWGSKGLKKARDDVKGWLRNKEEQLNQLGGDARKNVKEFLEGVKGLAPEELRRLSSVIGSDFPISVKDGKVRFELGRMRLRLPRDSDLAKLWGRVLDEGGLLVNNLKAGSQRVARLTGLDDKARRDELIAALDELVRTCPNELLDKLGKRDYDDAREKVVQARKALQDFVKRADAEVCKRMAQILAHGMTLVKDKQGNVVAVERPIKAELDRFKASVERFQNKVLQEELEKFAKRIKLKLEEIDKLNKEAKDDDKQLEKIAQEEIPGKVAALREDLKIFQKKIAAAEDALKDAETGVEIAAAEKQAADLLSDAAELRLEQGKFKVDQAILRETQADLLIKQAGLQIQEKELEVQAAVKRSTLNQNKLRHIYATCRLWGVDPRAEDDKEMLEESLALTTILTVENPAKRPHQRLLLHDMAQGTVGMVQWLRLLNIPQLPDKSRDLALAEPLPNPGEWAAAQLGDVVGWIYSQETPAVLAANFRKRAYHLQRSFVGEAPVPDEYLGFARAVGVAGTKITWLPDQTDPRLAMLPQKLRGKTLGCFKYRFTVKESDDDQRSSDFAEVQVAPNPSSSYYFLVGDSFLVHERGPNANPFPVVNLRFLVVPPTNPVGNPAIHFAGPSPLSRFLTKQLNDPLEETILLGQIRQRLGVWKKLQLMGAVGDWTVYILATDVLNERRRLKRIEECRPKLKLTFRIPYIEVPVRIRKSG